MLEWLISMFPLVFAFAVASTAWRIGKRVLSMVDEPAYSSPVDPARELRLSQARMRRLRTARYAAEHASWSAEFSALGGGCSCHGAPAPRRSASRYVPYL